MSKQYEEALARFLNGALDTAEKLGEFAKAELPLWRGCFGGL